MTIRRVTNVLRRISLPRLLNLSAALASYAVSRVLRRSIVWGKPAALTIEPTNRCNLQCPECPSGNGTLQRRAGNMDLEAFRRIVDSVSSHTMHIQLFFEGEPLLNRDLSAMVSYAHKKRISVSISTNAQLIDKKRAEQLIGCSPERLIISLDGFTEESYRSYRVGGTLKKVFEALEHLHAARMAIKNRTELVIQMLVTKQNEQELPLLRDLAKRYNAVPALKTMQVYSTEGAERFLPVDVQYRRYEANPDTLQMKSELHNHCLPLWIKSVITWDGIVVPCCFDKDAEYSFGDLSSESFAAVWTSPAAQAHRTRVLTDRRAIPICTNCTEGMRVFRK